MCTAVSFRPKDHYFGRNLDLERSYGEKVIITPRHYPFHFRNGHNISSHYAIIGIATSADNYPLYYEASNEAGLSMAGLNFPDNAYYFPKQEGKDNISPFELIPWLLCRCKTICHARQILSTLNLWGESFSSAFPLSPLHWLLADRNSALTIECTREGLRLYDNAVGVLTNNPPFPYHLHNLTNYMTLSSKTPTNNQPITLEPYSLGMGSFGLPGDMSSGSRFVKAAFTKFHSKCSIDETSSVNQFFYILDSVRQPKGMTQLKSGEYEYTRYSSCYNTDKGILYYTTYDNRTIMSVNMHFENLEAGELISYPIIDRSSPILQNKNGNISPTHGRNLDL